MKTEYINSSNPKEFVYKFADGKTVVLTADEENTNADAHPISMEWINILRNEETAIYNNEQSETRRHCSMDTVDPYIPSNKSELAEIEYSELWAYLKATLTSKQAFIARAYFLEGKTHEEIASFLGISRARVTTVVLKLRKKFQKNL